MAAVKNGDLSDLVHRINVCASKEDGYRVTAACHLAECEVICKRDGLVFTKWLKKSGIKFSYGEARKLAVAGASPNPTKAIADMRKGSNARVKKHRAKKVVLRNTTISPEDDEDELDGGEPGDDEQTIWRRGVWNRSKIAAGDALFEDWSQFKSDDELVNAAKQTVAAWVKLVAYLEELNK